MEASFRVLLFSVSPRRSSSTKALWDLSECSYMCFLLWDKKRVRCKNRLISPFEKQFLSAFVQKKAKFQSPYWSQMEDETSSKQLSTVSLLPPCLHYFYFLPAHMLPFFMLPLLSTPTNSMPKYFVLPTFISASYYLFFLPQYRAQGMVRFIALEDVT